MKLKSTILNFYSKCRLADISRVTVSLTIEGRNEMLGDLRIIGYKQLKSIEVKDKSLENIRSLIIKNNPKLRQITFKNDACKYTVNVEIAS